MYNNLTYTKLIHCYSFCLVGKNKLPDFLMATISVENIGNQTTKYQV